MSESKALNREAILRSGRKRPVERVDVPEWSEDGSPCHVFVKGMTAAGHDAWDEVLSKNRGQLRAHTLATYICDADGKPLFTPDDIPLLCELGAAAAERCFDRIMHLSGLGAKAKAEIEKN